jgi:hypothetical protein
MDLKIEPYVGVGTLRFGMTPSQVHHAAGDPSYVDHGASRTKNKTREEYPFGAALLYEGLPDDRQLVEMTFYPECTDLAYGDIHVFRARPRQVFRALLTADPGAGEYVGVVIFPALGISTTGFPGTDKGELTLTAFKRGRMDEFLPLLRPAQPR